MRQIVALCVLGTLLISVASAQAQPAGQPALTLERLEEMAIANNPTLAQAQSAVESALGRAQQAGAWPNPIIGYSAAEVSRGPVSRGGEHGVFAEQTILLGGKRALGRAVFERESEQAQALAALQEQRVRSAVRVAYYEALTLERRVEVNERLAQLGFEAVNISRQLYNVGAADNPDVLESEVEARRAQLDASAARNARFAVWKRLAALVGEPSLTPQPLAGSIDAAIPELNRATVLQTLLSSSPEVLAARADVARNAALVAQAQRVTFPDLFLRGGSDYNRELLESGPVGTPRPVGWEASFEAGVSIPLFNRNQGGIAAARAEQARAETELRRVQLSIEVRVAASFETYLTSLRAAEAYRNEMLPRAEQAYRLYLARYREAAAAYPQVLVAQRTLFQLSDDYLRNVDAAWRAALRMQGFLLDDDGLGAVPRAGEATGTGTTSEILVQRR